MPVIPEKKWQPKTSLLDILKGRQRAILRIDADRTIGEINPHIYGHFIEHLERCIYGGVWTENGERLREDVLRLVQPLKPPVIRYPGGNFASAYHWEDGIGLRESRQSALTRPGRSKKAIRLARMSLSNYAGAPALSHTFVLTTPPARPKKLHVGLPTATRMRRVNRAAAGQPMATPNPTMCACGA